MTTTITGAGFAASQLTGALPAISAASLTNIPIASGGVLQIQFSETSSSVTQPTDNTSVPCGVAYKELICRGAGSTFYSLYSCESGTQAVGSWTGTHQFQTSTDGGSTWSGWTEEQDSAYWYFPSGTDNRRQKFWHTISLPNLAIGNKIRIRAVCGSRHNNSAQFDGRKYESFYEVQA
jgi:hypothetical protein